MPPQEPTEACPQCGGSGWRIQEDGRAGTAEPCTCQSQLRVPRLLAGTGVPARYTSCRLESFHTRGEPALAGPLAVSRRYVDEFLGENGQFVETGLLYAGPPGVGKTYLACAVLQDLVKRYSVRGKFVDWSSLIHQIQATFENGAEASKSDVLDPVMSAEVLVLDELGVQKPTAWVTDVLYLVLNTRYSRRLPTIFTTNYRIEQSAEAARSTRNLDRPASSVAGVGAESLATRIPAMLISRLHEMALLVPMDASDIRHQLKNAANQRPFAP